MNQDKHSGKGHPIAASRGVAASRTRVRDRFPAATTVAVACLLLSRAAPATEPAPVPFAVTLTSPYSVKNPHPLVNLSVVKMRTLTGALLVAVPWRDVLRNSVNTCESVTPSIELAAQLGMQIVIRHDQLAAEHVLIPDQFEPASWSNPAVRQAYRDEIACFAALQPDYFVVSSELDIARVFHRAEYDLYANVIYPSIYALVKSISPSTSVGVSYSYLLAEQGIWLARDELVGPQDFYGFTSYLGVDGLRDQYPTPAEVPDDFYGAIRAELGPQARVLFAEFAWSSYYADGLVHQVEWLRRLNGLMAAVEPELVVWAALHDIYDFAEDPELLSHNNAGLRFLDGNPKPVWFEALERMNDGALLPRATAPQR